MFSKVARLSCLSLLGILLCAWTSLGEDVLCPCWEKNAPIIWAQKANLEGWQVRCIDDTGVSELTIEAEPDIAAAIAVPNFISYRNKSRIAAAVGSTQFQCGVEYNSSYILSLQGELSISNIEYERCIDDILIACDSLR